MTLKEKIMKLQTYKMYEDEDTVYVERDDVLKLLEQETCEEYILKFYYVESLDDYWIGKRLGNMYYAEWDFKLKAFVWTYSKYLPWGEHVVEPNTLWKEYTYPSEPKEISFNEWIKGFLKKHGMEQQTCEDCISRQAVLDKFAEVSNISKRPYHDMWEYVEKMPPITPQQTEWIPVSERLPEENGEYLVRPSDAILEDYSDFSKVMIMPYDADCEAFGWWREKYDPVSLGYLDSEFGEFEVLAWMPLPQEYTESDGEE